MASPPLYRNGGENQSSLSSLSLHLRSPFAYMRLHYLRSASLRALAGPYSLRPNLPPTSNLPVPTCSPSLLESPSPPPLPVFQPDRNPQEFHFVCQPNYTPQFYTFPSTHAPTSSFLSPSFLVTIPLYSRIFPENIPSSSLSLSFLQRQRNFNSKDVRERERERGNYVSFRTINNEFKSKRIKMNIAFLKTESPVAIYRYR